MINRYNTILPEHITLINDKTVRKTAFTSREDTYFYYKAIINHFINNPDPLVVNVANYQAYGKQSNGAYEYSYDMMRMCMLDQNEKNIIAQYFFDYNGKEMFAESISLDQQIIDKKYYSELLKFLKQIYIDNRYNDLHYGNIMKNEIGDYCLVDLEGFNKYNYDMNHLDNAWIKVQDNEAA